MDADALVRAWRANDAINLLLLEHVEEEGLRQSLSTRGGRDVALQLGHIHHNRVMQLERRAKDLAEGLERFPPKISPSRAALRKAFRASGKAVETFLRDLAGGKPKRRPFKNGIATTLAYLIAHEAHHRGQILLTLKVKGHPVDKAVRDGLWGGWDK